MQVIAMFTITPRYTVVIQYDGEMSSHYAPIDGMTSPVYDLSLIHI